MKTKSVAFEEGCALTNIRKSRFGFAEGFAEATKIFFCVPVADLVEARGRQSEYERAGCGLEETVAKTRIFEFARESAHLRAKNLPARSAAESVKALQISHTTVQENADALLRNAQARKKFGEIFCEKGLNVVAFFLAAEVLGIEAEEIVGVIAVITQRAIDENGAAQSEGCVHDGFVGAKNELFGNWAHAVEDRAANGELARCETAFADGGDASFVGSGEIDARNVVGCDEFGGSAIGERVKKGVADSGDIGILGEGVEHGREFVFCPPIIGVEEGDEFAVEFGKGGVEGGSLTAVRFSEITDARREFGHERSGVVGGTVVDDEDFEFGRREALGEDAFDGLFEELALVVGVDEGGDEGLGHVDRALAKAMSSQAKSSAGCGETKLRTSRAACSPISLRW